MEEPREDIAMGNEQEPLMLRTENLVKRYGKRTVVNHVSIDVKQGDRGVAWTKRGREDYHVLYDGGTDCAQ